VTNASAERPNILAHHILAKFSAISHWSAPLRSFYYRRTCATACGCVRRSHSRNRIHNRKQCCAANELGHCLELRSPKPYGTSLQLQAAAHITCQCFSTKWICRTRYFDCKTSPINGMCCCITG
jgi:hypothetical protein